MDFAALIVRLLPVLGLLALAAVIETVVPLRQQSRRLNGRLPTNVALLGITFGLGTLLNFVLAIGTAYVQAHGLGLLQIVGAGTVPSFIVTLLALDGATYLAHRLLHRIPSLWRVHLVHHIDASVDATTAFRQHPVEGLIRFSFIAAPAWILGAPPVAVAIYRLLGSLNSDYANLFSFFDRMFGSYTQSSRGTSVAYGIDGYDAPEHQSLGAVLWLPFRRSRRSGGSAAVRT